MGDSAITGYNLQYRLGNSGGFTAGPRGVPAGTTTATLTNLAATTAYEVQVQAVNDSGPGPWSPSGTGTTVAAAGGICNRTQQVQDAILAEISGVTDCANVTAAHLAAIVRGTGLNEGLDLNSKRIASLRTGDFAGLSSLVGINLDNNQLISLPAGVFNGLTALTGLSFVDNQLTSLPEGVFDGLTVLETLNLYGNQISTAA